ncbi:MAG: peptidoglycan-binding protein [Candidatus Tectomicrobia bacterium]|nr:peptidoglycan-binding protein [Candidatus Tectomicrobia bacterium]
MQSRLRLVIVSLLSTFLLSGLGVAQERETKALKQLMPLEMKLGECYAQVFVPAVFKTQEVEELKREASERFEIVPPKYEWSEQTVMVQEPTERIEVVPAEYEWVEEKVLVKPAASRVEVIEPQFEPVVADMIAKPAHHVWKEGSGPFQRINHATGQIMCLLEQPAIHKKITKYVLKTPGSTKSVEVPAQHETVRKRVVKTPASIRTVKVPAQYKVIKVAKLVSAAQAKRIVVPAEYQKVAKQVKVKEGRIEWQPVLCETNVTPPVVASLQRSLHRAGYDPGKIDGRIGKKTSVSLEAYQRDKGLPVGNLTLETLKSLGVKLGLSEQDNGTNK